MVSLPVETAHPELFHYTTRSGLEGILTSQSLWATNYRHLNDSTELFLFKERLKKLLVPTAKDILVSLTLDGHLALGVFNEVGGIDEAASHDSVAFVEACFEALHDEVYIVSCCGTPTDAYVRQNGLLSQWRGYGDRGGFCLEIDCRSLIGLLQDEADRFAHLAGHVSSVVYSDDEASLFKEFEDELHDMRAYLKEMFRRTATRADEGPDAAKFLPSFVRCLTRYKHRAFKEENEVRIVWISPRVDQEYHDAIQELGDLSKQELDELSKPIKPKKVRGPANNQVSYVELLDDVGVTLPINRLIVGPQKDQEQVAEELKGHYGHLQIKIECSDIPYVTR